MNVEGTSLARSAGPWCITPGCGFPWGCLFWLTSVWEWGKRSTLATSASLPAREPSWSAAAAET